MSVTQKPVEKEEPAPMIDGLLSEYSEEEWGNGLTYFIDKNETGSWIGADPDRDMVCLEEMR